jgi:hypothetical protein
MPVDFESCARIAKSTAPRAENWTSAMTTEKALGIGYQPSFEKTDIL